jgi:predicted transcriptional regulator
MKTAISIPDPIFQKAERIARKLGISRSALYSRAVSQLIEAYDEDDITARLDAVLRNIPSDLDPILADLQSRTTDDQEW